jgi:hypothetical protein
MASLEAIDLPSSRNCWLGRQLPQCPPAFYHDVPSFPWTDKLPLSSHGSGVFGLSIAILSNPSYVQAHYICDGPASSHHHLS